MQLIGFNLSKITAEKKSNFANAGMNTHVEFTDIGKDKSELLKEYEITKVSFKFIISYNGPEKENKKESSPGYVLFEGVILLSTDKEETKSFQKFWKKREIPPAYALPLYNYILKRCSVKALQLEEDINLPSHIPFPQVRPQPKEK